MAPSGYHGAQKRAPGKTERHGKQLPNQAPALLGA
jgi:hypothetical protein